MQGVYWRRSWGSRREGEGKEERVKEKQAGIRLEVGGDRHSIPSKRTRTWTRTRTRTQKMEWDEAPFIGEGGDATALCASGLAAIFTLSRLPWVVGLFLAAVPIQIMRSEAIRLTHEQEAMRERAKVGC